MTASIPNYGHVAGLHPISRSSAFYQDETERRRTLRNVRARWENGAWRPLEPLEARTLFDAVIQISGNGNVITNTDTTPSITDFTDFGPTSTKVSSAIGVVTRTFTIVNTGDTALTFTGASPITITGANARDFVVTTAAASTVDAGGGTTTFTISFKPRGAGERTASVTVASSDPATPAYTFSIQGEGIATKTAKSGLQTGIVTAGMGSGAVGAAAVTINYTGYTTSGTFESTNGTPVTVVLGASDTLSGFTQGLAGAKAGETLFLAMPASLAYGDSAHGSVPADTPVMFEVTVVSVENPTTVVSGNGTAITFGSTTPNASDNTFIGTVPAGSSEPITVTFTVANGNDAVVQFPKTPAVFIKGGGKSFTVSQLTIDSSQDFATFTVTYNPVKAGTQTAVVHVRTSDPAHPDFVFTVGGTTTPFVDLATTAVGTIKVGKTDTIVSGAGTTVTVPVTVANLGNISVPKGTTPVLVNVYLQDIASSTNTLISSQTINMSGLGAGKAKKLKLGVTVPGTIATGTYEPYITINEDSAVTEQNASNNTLLGAQVLNVEQGVFNLGGSLVASTFPATTTVGTDLTGRLNVSVSNTGSLTIPAGQTVVIQVIAHPDTGDDVVLGSSTVTLSGLAPGRAKTFSVPTTLVGGLTSGHYILEASITPVQALNESSTADNLLTTTLTGSAIDLTVT
jgi:hypothetical protein